MQIGYAQRNDQELVYLINWWNALVHKETRMVYAR